MSSRKRLIYDSESSNLDSSDSEYDIKNDLDYSDSDLDSEFYNKKPKKRKIVKSKIIIKPEVKRKRIEKQIKPNKRIKTKTEFLPFDKALDFARSLGLGGNLEWRTWCKEGMSPPNVPRRPDQVYKHDGWQGWGHWLGTGNQLTKQFLPFEEALTVVQSLGLANQKEWHAWGKEGMRPANVPGAPDQVYKHDGWQGWGHWLGTGNAQPQAKQFLPFDEALACAHSLGLASMRAWKVWCKEGRRPPNVPADPSKTYKHGGWHGWGHWLGTGSQPTQEKQFLPFEEAVAVARSLGMANQKEWRAWCRTGMRSLNVPSHPERVYKHDGWQNWKHWLTPHSINYVSYIEAKTATFESKIKTKEDWDKWCISGKKPKNIPDNPDIVYKNNDSLYKWYNWESFLLSRNFLIINTRSQETRQERKNRIFKKNKVVLKAKRQSKKIK